MIRIFARLSRRRVMDLLAGAAFGVVVAAVSLPLAQEAPPPKTAAAPAPEPAGGPELRATALGVVDGDTFEARILAFPGHEIVARVRIDGVDTPERRGRCRAETDAAEAATAALDRLVRDRTLTLTGARGDKYFGRVIARVEAPGVGDLAQALIAGGHGRAYAGGRRASWC